MALNVVQCLRTNYEEILTGIDPIIDRWLFMQSPVPIILILSFYLYFILKLGPQLMADRKPMRLKEVMVLYNVYQIVFSGWMFSKAFQVDSFFGYVFSFGCRSVKDEEPELLVMIWDSAWWYFFSKIVDLLDTVFIVLRKKQNQISFLHIYHHTSMVFFTWGYLKYLPGEQGVVIGFLNSFVHFIMYFYYLVAALGPRFQRFLWWKKYLTRIQLAQFAIIFLYMVLTVTFNCKKFQKSLTYFFVLNSIVFIWLFSDFYRKAYRKKTIAAAKVAAAAALNADTQNNNEELLKKLKAT